MFDWTGRQVLIIGAARQGIAAARWLIRHGARVTVNDQHSADQMGKALQELAGTDIQWILGSHPLDALDSIDIVCISGGVPLTNPLIQEALHRNLPLTNDTQIFMETVPSTTVGITGSSGKTTTTTMVGDMAEIPMGKRAFIGGNIGDPLLNYVDEMTSADLAIMEISSFQLEQMSISPDVAVVLNITPNHLDRHGTMESYIAAKKRILDFQEHKDMAILCRDDPGSWSLLSSIKGKVLSFGFSSLAGKMDGTYLSSNKLYLRQGKSDMQLMSVEDIPLRGDHNIMNTLAAFAIGWACQFPPKDMITAVKNFKGVPHRLEFVREWHGAKWYNDSIATAPERTLAAIRSFNEPIILLLGGRDKDLPWDALAAMVSCRVDHVILFGEAAGKIKKALLDHRGTYSLDVCDGFGQAVQIAANLAGKGDVVLFSPGGTSFDQFKDFEERGEEYKEWVLALS